MTTETRLEADSIGTMEVPAEAYYGVQALRAKQNFPITGTKLHPVFIRNLAQVKKAAAITNNNAGLLPKDKMDAIIKACDEVIAGKWAEEFIVDAIQGGAGTSAHLSFIRKFFTAPFSSMLIALISWPPISMTVRTFGFR